MSSVFVCIPICQFSVFCTVLVYFSYFNLKNIIYPAHMYLGIIKKRRNFADFETSPTGT